MNIEKLGGKKEPFVPKEEQEAFSIDSTRGAEEEARSKELSDKAKEEKSVARKSRFFATGFGVAGVANAVTGNIINTAAAIWGASHYGEKASQNRIRSEVHELEAEHAKDVSEMRYNSSRGIVTEGMKQGGAEEVGGHLQATPEQIEIARKEMIEKYGGKE